MIQDKMVKAQFKIEEAMSSADDESQEYVRSLVLKVCTELDIPYKAYTYVLSWAIGTYC